MRRAMVLVRLVRQPNLEEGGTGAFDPAEPVVIVGQQWKPTDHEADRSFARDHQEARQCRHARVTGQHEVAHTRRVRHGVQVSDLSLDRKAGPVRRLPRASGFVLRFHGADDLPGLVPDHPVSARRQRGADRGVLDAHPRGEDNGRTFPHRLVPQRETVAPGTHGSISAA